jgi:penicillin-binding protein 1B
MMAALSPEALVLARPDAIELVAIDPQSGLSGKGCPGAIDMPFIKGSEPQQRAPCASDGLESAVKDVVDAVGKAVEPVKNWLERLFGR